jgi:hypothetical protein
LLGVDAFGQWNTAIKLSIPALAPSYPALVRFLLPFALALDYESFVCDFYLDILGLKSRQLGMDQVITVALGTRFWQPHRIDREELIRELNESYTEFNNVIAVYQIA